MGETAYDKFRNDLAADHGWAWSYICNIAMSIYDNSKLSHGQCNELAAKVFNHMFHIDVTNWKEYLDIVSNPDSWLGRETTKTLVETGTRVVPDENSIYINVTGFKANSGATHLATSLKELFAGHGHHVELNVAETTLEPEQIGLVDGNPDPRLYFTAVESLYHTDMVGVAELPSADDIVQEAILAREADEVAKEADIFDGEDYGFGESGECDGFDTDEGAYDEDPTGPEDYGQAEHLIPTRSGKTELNVVLSGTDTDPIGTLRYIESQFPKADIKTTMELDQFATDNIHKQIKPARKVVVTLDPADPHPERTIEHIQELITSCAKSAFPNGLEQVQMNWTADVTASPVREQIRKTVEAYLSPEFFPAGSEQVIGNLTDRLAEFLVERYDTKELAFDVTTQPEGLTMVTEEIKLSNPEHLKKAYLLRHVEEDTYSIQYIDVDAPSFDFQKYMDSKFEVVHTDDLNTFALAVYDANKEAALVPEYQQAIHANNVSFVARFGLKSDHSSHPMGVKDKLNFYELDQKDIPAKLWDFLEYSWIAFLDPIKCEELAEFLDDDRASMAGRQYDVYAGAVPGVTYRKHPDHEELFVKLILKEASEDTVVNDWARKMNLI